MILIVFSKYKLQLAILGIFLILLIIFMIASPKVFLSIAAYKAIFTTLPITIILAVSLVYVIVCAEIDLSFGSIMGLSAWMFTSLLLLGKNPILALLFGLGIGCAAGALNGVLVTKVGISSLVTTLGMSFFWRGVIMVGTQGHGAALVTIKGTPLYNTFVGRIGGFPVQILWAIAFAFISWLILNRHRFGAHVYYTGDNKESARMMGVKVDRVKIIAFAIVGFASAFAGIMSVLVNLVFWPTCGGGMLLPTLAAVFIGGTPTWGGVGTVFGAFFGAFIIGFMETGIIAAGLTGFWTQLVYGLVIVLSLLAHRFLRRERR